MKTLKRAILDTPIIDHHAHNLLQPSKTSRYNLLSITSEASGPALDTTKSSLAHHKAVKQLSEALNCRPTWEAVEAGIAVRRKESPETWAKQCFAGIETVLIDDGLDPDDVHPFDWHDRLVRSPCKRIVRIERVVEDIVLTMRSSKNFEVSEAVENLKNTFDKAIVDAVNDPRVAGFKSVICYRTGLDVQSYPQEAVRDVLTSLLENARDSKFRLQHEVANPYFLHFAVGILKRMGSKKPLQFHTGLGDNDINLRLSNAAYLQTFIKDYPEVNIVLLHASYPYTMEAGYLATVYPNVYLDIGEVFPQIR